MKKIIRCPLCLNPLLPTDEIEVACVDHFPAAETAAAEAAGSPAGRHRMKSRHEPSARLPCSGETPEDLWHELRERVAGILSTVCGHGGSQHSPLCADNALTGWMVRHVGCARKMPLVSGGGAGRSSQSGQTVGLTEIIAATSHRNKSPQAESAPSPLPQAADPAGSPALPAGLGPRSLGADSQMAANHYFTAQLVKITSPQIRALRSLPRGEGEMWFPWRLLCPREECYRPRLVGLIGSQASGKTVIAQQSMRGTLPTSSGGRARKIQSDSFVYSPHRETFEESLLQSSIKGLEQGHFKPTGTQPVPGHIRAALVRPQREFGDFSGEDAELERAEPARPRRSGNLLRRLSDSFLSAGREQSDENRPARNYVPLIWHDMAGELAVDPAEEHARHIQLMDSSVVVVDGRELLSGEQRFTSILTAARWLDHLAGNRARCALAVTKMDLVIDAMTQSDYEEYYPRILSMAEDLEVRLETDHAPARELLGDLLLRQCPAAAAHERRRQQPVTHPAQDLRRALGRKPRVFFLWTEGLTETNVPAGIAPFLSPGPPVTHGLAKLMAWCLNEKIASIVEEGQP